MRTASGDEQLIREWKNEHEELVKEFLWEGKVYQVTSTKIYIDEVKLLMNALVKQTVTDYSTLKPNEQSLKKKDKLILNEAEAFLFNDSYKMHYGGLFLTFRDILEIITGDEPNMEMFRQGLKRRLKE